MAYKVTGMVEVENFHFRVNSIELSNVRNNFLFVILFHIVSGKT